MIQKIEHVGRKGIAPTFIFFIPKWSMIKNLTKIERHQLKKSKNLSLLTIKTANTQFSNNNYPKALKASFLSQVFNVDKKEILDSKSIIESEAHFDNIDNNDVIATLLATNTESSSNKTKKD